MSSMQAAFASALIDPAACVPAGLVAWNGSDVAWRYAVYRNNVAVSLVNALQDTLPVTCERIGSARFRGIALRFVRSAPPRSPLLATYGAGFPDFIAEDEVRLQHPELADLARLEFLRVEAYHAADAEPLSEAQWSAVLAQPERLPELCFGLHPSVRTIASRHAVVSIWAAHQGLREVDGIDPAAAQSAVITRAGLEVVVLHASPNVTHFLNLLGSGIPLGCAADTAADTQADFDLTAGLAYLVRHRLLAAVFPPAEDSR